MVLIRLGMVLAAVLLVGCASARPPMVSALPNIVEYTTERKAALNAERPKVKACCPLTDRAMQEYGDVREKIEAGEQIQQRSRKRKKGPLGLFQ